MKEVEQDVRAAAEGLVDFQPDVTHEVVPENKRRKKLFEGLYLEGRPPINVGVTSSGDFFGGTAVALTDTLGDQLFSLTVLSVASYRIYDGRYTNLASRLHYGINFYDQTYFFYPYYAQYSQYYGYNTRDLAIATQRFTGGQVFVEYPFDTFRRIDFGVGVAKVNEQFGDQQVEQQICQQNAINGLPCFLNNGWQLPISARIVQETTRFAEFGPLSGSTFSVGFTYAPGVGSFLQRQTVDVDLRKYLRLGPTSALLAVRGRGFYSTGDNPDYFYFGGNMELRGLPVLQLRRQPGLLRERRAAPAAHPPRGDPDRHPRPAARDGVLRHRRRPLQGPELQVLDERARLLVRRGPDLRRAGHRLAAPGRPRLLGLRPSALLPRLPPPLRLDEVHGLRHHQQGLGLRLLDRVRLLGLGGTLRRVPPRTPRSARASESRSLRSPLAVARGVRRLRCRLPGGQVCGTESPHEGTQVTAAGRSPA